MLAQGWLFLDEQRRLDEAAALRDSEARFRDFAAVASDWLWETDADHRFTYFSATLDPAIRATLASALGKTRWEFCHADLDAPLWRSHLANLEARRPIEDFTYSAVAADGTTRWMSVSARPVFAPDGSFKGYRGAGSDRTAHRQMEIAVEESEARLRAFIDNSPEHITLKDAEGRIVLVNRQFAKLRGIDPIEAIGRPLVGVNRPEAAAKLAALHRRICESGETIREEIDHTFPTGKRSFIVTKFPVATRDGSPPLIGTILNDVTEFKRLREQLHHAQKMETVGQLTGGIAHDFNNLLTVIIGNIEMLMVRLDGAPQLRQLAEAACNGATRAADLTGRLLAFSRRQNLEPVSLDLNHLVADMTELLDRTLGEPIELRTELSEGLWPALADPAQVESVLLNLAVNARDAMEEGGRLTIATDNVELGADYARSQDEVRAGAYVCVSVTDTGSGMPPEIAERAFEPFFTTKEVGKGTGLGLSMVYGFVKQSGGHVEVLSEVGLGTTIKVYLPRAETVTAAATRTVVSGARVSRGYETILAVEDNTLVRAYVVEQLRAFGYTVLDAASGAEALAILDGGQQVDLLFTDVVMPGGMSGFELADAVLERRPGIKILFTSGYAEEAMRQRGQLPQGMRLLSKPYPRATLAATIRNLLDAPASGSDAAAPSHLKSAHPGGRAEARA